jgi:hypothetical protein
VVSQGFSLVTSAPRGPMFDSWHRHSQSFFLPIMDIVRVDSLSFCLSVFGCWDFVGLSLGLASLTLLGVPALSFAGLSASGSNDSRFAPMPAYSYDATYLADGIRFSHPPRFRNKYLRPVPNDIHAIAQVTSASFFSISRGARMSFVF